MAFVPSKRTKDILLWMLSTKMLPAVGVLYPIYLIFIELGLLDTRIGLVVVILMLINLPIIVWMLYTYFKEIPARSSKPPGWTGRRCARKSSTCSRRWRCRASPPQCC
jgi:ABC-type glycerol-3-phosphate transport system permease component